MKVYMSKLFTVELKEDKIFHVQFWPKEKTKSKWFLYYVFNVKMKIVTRGHITELPGYWHAIRCVERLLKLPYSETKQFGKYEEIIFKGYWDPGRNMK